MWKNVPADAKKSLLPLEMHKECDDSFGWLSLCERKFSGKPKTY